MVFSDEIIIEDYKIRYKKKFSSSILIILTGEDKLNSRLTKHEKKVDIIIFNLGIKFLFLSKIINVSCNIKLQVTNSSVHLMFPDSLWIINVQYLITPAPISSGPATHQGTLSYVYPMCTRKYYRYTYVLHPSGTSSVTVQSETSLKIYFSSSETVFDHSQLLIKLDRIFISTNFKACNNLHRRKSLSFQKVNGEQIFCLFSILPLILNVKFVCNHQSSTYSSYKKCKLEIFKRILIISHELIVIKANVLVNHLQKTYKNHLDLINLIFFKYAKACKRSFFSIIPNAVLIINNNGDI